MRRLGSGAVDRPADLESYRSIHATLLNIVTLSLDQDPTLLPRRVRSMSSASTSRSMSTASLPAMSGLTMSAPTRPLGGPTPNESALSTSPADSVLSAHMSLSAAAASVSPNGADEGGDDRTGPDPDDFVIMEEKQAKRIVALVEQCFGVELSPDVVVADANVGALARRVVGARSLVPRTESEG